MYYSNNQLDKAVEIYQRALNLNYENEHQHYYLGNSFFKKGIVDRAIEEWEVVISLKQIVRSLRMLRSESTRQDRGKLLPYKK